MDYKEKYNTALERASKLRVQNPFDTVGQMVEHIFPELKESEDERIRKWLIDWVNAVNYWSEQFTITKEQIIAWLEKQKDYIKLFNSAYTSNRDVIEFADKYSHTIWENLMDNFKKIENYSIGCNDVSDIVLNAIINTYNWLEKQDEQKPYGQRKECEDCQFNYVGECKGSCQMKRDEQNPTDKVEPKFKEGDYIVSDNITSSEIWRVINIDKDNYYNIKCITNPEYDEIYRIPGFVLEKDYRLWTIEDAKRGDVLVDVYGNIGIFDKCYDFDWMSCCSLGNNRGFQYFTVEHENEETYPATKEQRDLFFSKMKEAGWEWDSKNKELKKIESKKLDPDKIIEWMKNMFSASDMVIDKFKKEFEL